MPLYTKEDQTIGIAPEQQARPNYSMDFPSVPTPSSPTKANYNLDVTHEEPVTPEQVESEFEVDDPELQQLLAASANAGAYDDPEMQDMLKISESEDNTVLGKNATAGLITGLTNDTFSASAATTMESYLPLGRIQFIDAEGNFNPSWTSTQEWLGVTDDQWDAMTPEERRIAISSTTKDRVAKHYDADVNSGAYLAGNIAGMFADPTTMLPVIGASTKARAAWMSAVGASDMGMYQTAHEGAPTLGGVAFGAAVGPAMIYGGKAISKAYGKTKAGKNAHIRNAADDKIRQFTASVEKHLADTPNDPMGAMTRAHKEAGISPEDLGKVIDESTTGLNKERALRRANNIRNDIFTPVEDRIRGMNPRIHKQMMDMERKILEDNHAFMVSADEFLASKKVGLEKIRKSDDKAFREIKKAMLNADLATTKSLVQKHLGDKGMKALNTFMKTNDDAYNLWKQARNTKSTSMGKKVGMYVHRAVKDWKPIHDYIASKSGKTSKADLTRIENEINRRAKIAGRNLNDDELAEVYTSFLAGHLDPKKTRAAAGAATSRRMAKIPEELLDAFHDPLQAMHSYYKTMVDDVHTKAFFGKKIVDKHGDLIEDSIGELVNQEIKAGRLAHEDLEEFKTLLELRFVRGKISPHKAIQVFKDVGYSALLGNPFAAVVQLGDIALAATKYDMRDVANSLWQAVKGRGLTPKEWGLMDNMIEELASTDKNKLWGLSTKRLLQKSLKYGQFQRIDGLGKAVHLNASLKKHVRLAKTPKGITKLKAKWGDALTDKEFSKLISDLRNKGVDKATGELSPDVKTLVFADLADMQPITLLQMPATYLRNPNLRLAYMLRTFHIKYLNLLRKASLDQISKGNYKEAAAGTLSLMAAFTLGGAGTSELKNFLLGRDQDVAHSVSDAFLAQTGFLDRYALEELGSSKDPAWVIAKNLAPPVNILSPWMHTAYNASFGETENIDAKKMVNQIPVVGKIFSNFAMGGMEEYNRRRWQE